MRCGVVVAAMGSQSRCFGSIHYNAVSNIGLFRSLHIARVRSAGLNTIQSLNVCRVSEYRLNEPGLKSCAAGSNLGQLCSLYIGPVLSNM